MLRYVFSSFMILTLPLVSSYTSPLTFDNSSRASPSSSIPLIRIEKVFIAEPTLSAFCTISWPPVKIAIVSSKLAPVEAIAEAERSRPSIISSLLVANALPTELIFDIIPSLTSSTWTSNQIYYTKFATLCEISLNWFSIHFCICLDYFLTTL